MNTQQNNESIYKRMTELMLPEGILDYFDVVDVRQEGEVLYRGMMIGNIVVTPGRAREADGQRLCPVGDSARLSDAQKQHETGNQAETVDGQRGAQRGARLERTGRQGHESDSGVR